MKGSWRSDERLEWVRQQQQQLLKRRWQSVWARAGSAPSPSADASAETASLLHRIDMAAARLVMRNNDDVCVCEDDHKSLDKRMEKRRKANDYVGEGDDIARAKARVEANSEIVVIDNTNEEKSGAGGGIPPSHAHFLSHEGGITRGNKMNDNDSATANSQMKINDEHSANAETAKPSNGAISDESENATISVNRARVTSETEPPVTHASDPCAFALIRLESRGGGQIQATHRPPVVTSLLMVDESSLVSAIEQKAIKGSTSHGKEWSEMVEDYVKSKTMTAAEQDFVDMVLEFKKFKESSGLAWIPDHKSFLGSWCFRQRRMYRMLLIGEKTALSADRIRLLNYIGFPWTSPGVSLAALREKIINVCTSEDTEWLKIVKEYVKTNDMDICDQKFLDIVLALKKDKEASGLTGAWCFKQRILCAMQLNVVLDEQKRASRIQLLNYIGFPGSSTATSSPLHHSRCRSGVSTEGAPSSQIISQPAAKRQASDKKIITVVTKLSKADKLGLQICQVEDERMGESFVQVTSIAPNGLFRGTRIKVGMKLLSINGKECNTVKDAIDLAKAVEGELKIAAASVVKGAVLHEFPSNIRSETNKTKTIVVKKPSRDSKLGLNLIQIEDEKKGEFFVRVLSMATNSLLRGTSLKVGMTLLSINGKECKTVKDAVDLFMAAEGTLTICLSSSVEAAVIHKTHSNIRTEQTVVSSHSEYEPPGDDKGRVVSLSTDLIKLPNHADEKDELKSLLRACALEQYLDAFQAVGISSASELQGKMHDLSFMERFVEDAGLSASEAIRLQIRASRH